MLINFRKSCDVIDKMKYSGSVLNFLSQITKHSFDENQGNTEYITTHS